MHKRLSPFKYESILLLCILFLITGCNPFIDKSKIRFVNMDNSTTWDKLNHSFGQVVVGSYTNRVFKYTNNLKTSLDNCSDVTMSDTQNFTILSNTCTQQTMLPQVACEVDIEARPASSGLKTLIMERLCNGQIVNPTNEVVITADARTVNLSWDLSNRDFGLQDVFTGSADQIFTLSNSGDGTASNCSAPIISDPVNFSISVDTCGSINLTSSGSCAVTVASHPRSIGLKQATLSRTCTVGGVVSTTTDMITVNGTGPSLAWNLNEFDFGNIEIGVGDQQNSIVLQNTGTADATGCSSVQIDDNVNFWINDYCGGNDLAQGDSCQVDIGTNAQAVGPQSVTISRTCSYGGVATTTSNQFKFNGGHHLVQFSPYVFDFSSSLTPQVFTFSNAGQFDESDCDPAYLADDTHFSITSDSCSEANLAIGASCQITVTPHPMTAGAKTTTLNRACGFGQYVGNAFLSTTGSIAAYNGVGALHVGRYIHSATLLNDGSILALGGTGLSNNTYLSSVELYDPNLQSWTTKVSMSLGRNWVKSIRLQNGKVLVAGGSSGATTTNQIELYDPVLNTWQVKAPMNVARTFHTLSLLSDGKVLAVGGNSVGQSRATSLNDVEVYDPILNTWTVKAALGQDRYFHEAQTLQDGRALVFGGDSTGGRTGSVEIYNPTLNAWTVKTSLNNSRSQFSSGILPDGRVIALGGYGAGALASVEIYDPTLNSWTVKSPMSTARYYLATTVLPNGQVVVSGGMDNSNVTQNSVEIFNPALNTWTAQANMVDSRFLHSSTLLPNGQVLICGGAFSSSILATCEKR